MTPTVGRIVHYYPTGVTPQTGKPQAGIVTMVWSESCVNLALFDGNGVPVPKPPTSILLVQEGAETPTGGNYCCWPSLRPTTP